MYREDPNELLHERLRIAIEAADIGTWDYYPESGRLVWSDRTRAIFGFQPDAELTLDEFVKAVHPADQATVRDAIRNALDPTGALHFELEYRVLVRGEIRWVRAQGRSFLDDTRTRAIRFVGAALDITERKEIETKIAASEERYRAFVENSSEAIWRFELERPIPISAPVAEQIELTYKYAYLAECNDAMARMYGYAHAEEIVGARVTDMLVPTDPANIGYLEAFVASGYRLFDAGSSEVDREGNQKYFLNNLFGIIENGLLVRAWGTQRDVTGRKRADDDTAFLARATAVLNSSLDYETTLTRLADLVVPRIGDWCAVDIVSDDNGGYQRLAVSHPDPEKLAMIIEVDRAYPLDPDENPVVQVHRTGESQLMSDLPSEYIESFAKDERHLAIIRSLGLRSWMIVPMRVRNRVIGSIAILSATPSRRYDESDLAFAEELAARAATAVDNARLYKEAQEANLAKDEFLATVSHELRTPLTAILGWIKMLMITETDEETMKLAYETIERSAKTQAELIEDILDLSRIITGKFRLSMKRVHVDSIVRNVLETLQPTVNAKRIDLVVDIDEDLPVTNGDPNRLQQVFWNLVSNAVKFSEPERKIAVSAQRKDGFIEVAVDDEGQGIDPRFLPYVFDRFRQADTSMVRRHGGLGLGLNIAKQLIELHGGTIRAESEGIGKGARFSFRIPVVALPDESDVRSEAKERGRQVLAGNRILVVDDEDDSRNVIARMLGNFGANVVAASSAAGGLTELQRDGFDVVIADIAMPEEDGFSLLRRIRESGSMVPVIALTAMGRASDGAQYFDAGFAAYLRKPIDPSELASRVRATIQK